MFEHKVDEEVSLRLFTNNDSEEFYALVMNSKEHLQKWLTWVASVESKDDTDKSLKLRIESLVENNGFPMWFAIIFKDKLAGTIGFNDIDRSNSVGEVGYFLGEPFQRKRNNV
ncbi:GNAT family N-acetyltransferase [Virgibacillus halophilus]|uniref:GNAT family N-acetyltransferase n=1 Tax=Tigheibacillus halophilus TaxID=361280 RepID=A0ABU5C3P2_9BACI|nr:GNAT family N-acetyltransferase [Virgibacillus halophilus]